MSRRTAKRRESERAKSESEIENPLLGHLSCSSQLAADRHYECGYIYLSIRRLDLEICTEYCINLVYGEIICERVFKLPTRPSPVQSYLPLLPVRPLLLLLLLLPLLLPVAHMINAYFNEFRVNKIASNFCRISGFFFGFGRRDAATFAD